MKQGLFQIYTGNGKGKTTAATGLIVRALGQGLKVLLVRFLKPEKPQSGEILFLTNQEGLTILSAGVGVFNPEVPRAEIEASVRATFDKALSHLASHPIDLVVFDEMNGVLQRGDLSLETVLRFLSDRDPGLEVVFTGRGAPEDLVKRADLVSRIDAVKHPFDRGIPARSGIDY